MLMLNLTSLVKVMDAHSSPAPAAPAITSSAVEVAEDVHQLEEEVVHAKVTLSPMDADTTSLMKTTTVKTTMVKTMPDFQVSKSMEEMLVVSASLVL